MDKKAFGWRLSLLRTQKGVSARDMSLSIGQSAGYINNLENGVNYPSMSTFFDICEFLEVTPQDFFQGKESPNLQLELLKKVSQHLTPQQLEHLIAFLREIPSC